MKTYIKYKHMLNFEMSDKIFEKNIYYGDKENDFKTFLDDLIMKIGGLRQ